MLPESPPIKPLPIETLHSFSQLVYLDVAPLMIHSGQVRVSDFADYYLNNAQGVTHLNSRFQGVPQDLALWRPFLVKCKATYADWTIQNILDHNGQTQSGLYACTYTSTAGAQIIAFRGSEMLGDRKYENDYVNDFSLSYTEKTQQQAMVDVYFEQFSHTWGNAIYMTGHSLGGNLAAYAAITAPSAIQINLILCATFNAPGFVDLFVQHQQAAIYAIQTRLLAFQNEFDIVSSLLTCPVSPLIIASLFDPAKSPLSALDIFYPHSNFMFQTDTEGNLLLSQTGIKSRLCNIAHALSMRFMHLPQLTKKRIAGLLLRILYSPILHPQNQSVATTHRDSLLALQMASGIMLPMDSHIQSADIEALYRLIQQSEGAIHDVEPTCALLILLRLIQINK